MEAVGIFLWPFRIVYEKQFGVFYSSLVYCTAVWCIVGTAVWCILQQFSVFYSSLVYCTAVWCILQQFGIIVPVLVRCSKKNLATLLPTVTTYVRPHKPYYHEASS
jgi:hypothetical protein